MQIHIHTDQHIDGHEAFAAWATGEVQSALNHHKEQTTRVEVHMGDENGARSGQGDKRCLIEVRLAGHQPLAVTHHADTLYQAVTGAADKMNRMIETALGRAARSEIVPG